MLASTRYSLLMASSFLPACFAGLASCNRSFWEPGVEPEVQRMRHEAYSQRRHEMMRLCRQERKRLINAEQKVSPQKKISTVSVTLHGRGTAEQPNNPTWRHFGHPQCATRLNFHAPDVLDVHEVVGQTFAHPTTAAFGA